MNGVQKQTLTITLTPDGSVGVEGPINNKLLCYSMLELARDAIKDHGDKQAKSSIVRPDIVSIAPGARPF